MKCPKCNGKVYVTDTTNNDEDHEIYRRRVCKECGKIFYTTEFEVEYTDDFAKIYNQWFRFNIYKNKGDK